MWSRTDRERTVCYSHNQTDNQNIWRSSKALPCIFDCIFHPKFLKKRLEVGRRFNSSQTAFLGFVKMRESLLTQTFDRTLNWTTLIVIVNDFKHSSRLIFITSVLNLFDATGGGGKAGSRQCYTLHGVCSSTLCGRLPTRSGWGGSYRICLCAGGCKCGFGLRAWMRVNERQSCALQGCWHWGHPYALLSLESRLTVPIRSTELSNHFLILGPDSWAGWFMIFVPLQRKQPERAGGLCN